MLLVSCWVESHVPEAMAELLLPARFEPGSEHPASKVNATAITLRIRRIVPSSDRPRPPYWRQLRATTPMRGG